MTNDVGDDVALDIDDLEHDGYFFLQRLDARRLLALLGMSLTSAIRFGVSHVHGPRMVASTCFLLRKRLSVRC